MAKRLIGEVRRAELAQAAFEELVVSGIRGTTLEKVALRAGVSKGVVLHHFKDKDALFEAVMRRANRLLADGVLELLRHAETPIERVSAIIVGNFSDPIFNQQVCHAWICLCAEAPFNAANRRIQTIIEARLRSNLISALKDMVPSDHAKAIANQVMLAIDGVWLRASLREDPTSMLDGVRNVAHTLTLALDKDGVAESSIIAAIEKMEGLAQIILQSKSFTQMSLGYRLRHSAKAS